MLSTSLSFALLTLSLVSAAPARRQWWENRPTFDNLVASYAAEHSIFDLKKRQEASPAICDMNAALQALDLSAVSPPLPSPDADTILFQVVLGRGTQNYTCNPSSPTEPPVAAGALATLHNATCLAATAPEDLARLPAESMQLAPGSNDGASNTTLLNSFSAPRALASAVAGHHYFLDATTPFFNLDTAARAYGQGAVGKADASPAPAEAAAKGAVAWLKLDAKAGGDWRHVYRVNTVGGEAPESCEGLGEGVEVEYAAEYWLFV